MGRNVIIKVAVKLLAWNIQHGGGTRRARIIEEISAYDPDVIAMTEFRARPGVALCAAMKERGLPYFETTHPAENQNGIAVFSRTPMRNKRFRPGRSVDLLRWLDIDLPEHGFGIGVLHIMAAGSAKNTPQMSQRRASGRSCYRKGCRSRFCSSATGIPARTGLTKPARRLCARSTSTGCRRWLDGYVAASQPRDNGVYLVLKTEGRRAR